MFSVFPHMLHYKTYPKVFPKLSVGFHNSEATTDMSNHRAEITVIYALLSQFSIITQVDTAS